MLRGAGAILTPRSVAIVGISERSYWSRALHENLRHCGYQGQVYFINPNRTEVWGRRCYPNFASLPEPVEHAVVLVRAELVAASLAEGAARGLRSALVFASGIGEGEEAEAADRAAALRKVVKETGVRVCGPNCLGTMSVRQRLVLIPHPAMPAVSPGPVGAVFQSGGILQFWLQSFSERGGGVSYAVSSGNEIDLDIADYMDFLVADSETRVIALFIEGLRRPKEFVAVCGRALDAGKPIIAMKIGRSRRGQEQALSHTGAIAGDDATFNAFCHRYGVVRCRTLDEMNETVLAFSAGRLPQGRRMGFVIHSGGLKGIILDQAEDRGLLLSEPEAATLAAVKPNLSPDSKAENPLDASMNAALDANTFAEICCVFARDPNIDVLGINGVLPKDGRRGERAAAYRRIVDSTDKPVLAFARMSYGVNAEGRAFLERAGMPFLQGAEHAITAMEALVFHAERWRLGLPRLSPADSSAPDLNAPRLEKVLAEYGLPVPRQGVGRTPHEAAEIAAGMGFPVVVKIVSPDLTHKTEVGGIRLDLRSRQEVERAAAELAETLSRRAAQATLAGFLVQEMVRGIEVMLGAREDPAFGPVIVIGSGGTLVELLQDAQIRLLPITAAEIDELVPRLKLNKLLAGFRGSPAADVAALKRAILGFSELYLYHRHQIADLEINPLVVRPGQGGVAAVDVRLIGRRGTEAERRHGL